MAAAMRHCGFFVLRTPALPFQTLTDWHTGAAAGKSGDNEGRPDHAGIRSAFRSRLNDLLDKPYVREALFLASPDLDDSVDLWRRQPDTDRGRRAERGLVRYLSRMAGRCTPFGLFAGSAVGTVGDTSTLQLDERSSWRRRTRLDSHYLWTLLEHLGKDAAIRECETYFPNSSLCELASRYQYTEHRQGGPVGTVHQLVSIEKTPYLTSLLELAAGGARLAELVDLLAEDDVDEDEARAYVHELIDSQILSGRLAVNVTGSEPLDHVVQRLREIAPVHAAQVTMETVRGVLRSMDAEPHRVSRNEYSSIAVTLGKLGATIEPKVLFQVDLVTGGRTLTLSSDVMDEIARGAEILHALNIANTEDDALARFRVDFAARYEGREVPLAEALDSDVGVGFRGSVSNPNADASPLLTDIPFRPPEGEVRGRRFTNRETHLVRLLKARPEGTISIGLDPKTLQLIKTDPPPSPLPDALAVIASLAAASEEDLRSGHFKVYIKGVLGPSGASLLGRFCHGDPELLEHVRSHLRQEESLRPDAVFAEIVHLPTGRMGNVLHRPVLRTYEIPYVGASGAPATNQLTLDDLTVAVVEGRVVLRSRRLQCEVLPRLTTAHNFTIRSQPIYHFLSSLQQQALTGGATWSWGGLETAPFLPRVEAGRVVLARARWRPTPQDLELLSRDTPSDHAETAKWCAANRVPRFVAAVGEDGDNELPVDFRNPASVDVLLHMLRQPDAATIRLLELFPGPDDLCVNGPEGKYRHEIIVPLLSTRAPSEIPKRVRRATVDEGFRRTFPPASEWLYLKLYGGQASADALLRETIRPLVVSARAEGLVDRWFFIRYGDPDWHVRLRFGGRSERLWAELLPLAAKAFEREFELGRLWRVQVDTYEREVERYGGGRGTELSEELFCADSDSVLELIAMTAGDTGLDLRWRLVVLGVQQILNDLGLTTARRLALVRLMRAKNEVVLGATDRRLRKRLGEKFRKELPSLDQLLRADADTPVLGPAVAVLHERSLRVAATVAELRALDREDRLGVSLDALAESYVHMYANRMLRSAARHQELVIYDFLTRLYERQIGRPSQYGEGGEEVASEEGAR
jgi:lantibiotic biosynthesis protein